MGMSGSSSPSQLMLYHFELYGTRSMVLFSLSPSTLRAARTNTNSRRVDEMSDSIAAGYEAIGKNPSLTFSNSTSRVSVAKGAFQAGCSMHCHRRIASIEITGRIDSG